MKLLLDTHIILWALDDNPRLTNQTRNLIRMPKNGISNVANYRLPCESFGNVSIS